MKAKFLAWLQRFESRSLIFIMRCVAKRQHHKIQTSDNEHQVLISSLQTLVEGEKLSSDVTAQVLNELVKSLPGPDAIQQARALLLSRLPAEQWGLLPVLVKRDNPVMSTWSYQNELMSWDIGADELVLDIGSGGWPFKRANHLADKFPDQTTHRVEEMVKEMLETISKDSP